MADTWALADQGLSKKLTPEMVPKYVLIQRSRWELRGSGGSFIYWCLLHVKIWAKFCIPVIPADWEYRTKNQEIWSHGLMMQPSDAKINMETLTLFHRLFLAEESCLVQDCVPFSNTACIQQLRKAIQTQSFGAEAFVVTLLQFNFPLCLSLFLSPSYMCVLI